MTESMVEKVARAIATARAGRENAEESRFKGGNLWFEAKRDARAAVEAMQEPTDAMVLAACRVSLPSIFRHGLEALPTDGPTTRQSMKAVEETERKRCRAILKAALSPGEVSEAA